jgi:hypothetical protein
LYLAPTDIQPNINYKDWNPLILTSLLN